MCLASLGRMLGRMSHMAVSNLRMVPGLFMIAGFMSFSGFLVVPRCDLVMRCGRFVMLRSLRLRSQSR